MAEKRVNTFGTFLKTVRESSLRDTSQQRSARGGTVETVLGLVRQHPQGIETKELLDVSGVNVVEFGQVIERLLKIGAVATVNTGRGEVMVPGPQAEELLSLIK